MKTGLDPWMKVVAELEIGCDIFSSWQGITHRIYSCCQKYFQIIFLDNRAVV